MIREQNAASAIDAAQEFDKRRLGLVFKEGSFLKALYAASTVEFNAPTDVTARDYQPSASAISAMSAIVPVGCSLSPFSVLLSDAVIEVSDAVRAHVFRDKNVIRPLIQTLVERMEASFQAMPAQATFNPDIKRVDIPQPMRSNLFVNMLEGYEDTDYRPGTASPNVPAITADQVGELLNLGNQAIDTDIAAWVASLPPEFVVDTYNGVFGTSGPTMTQRLADQETGVDAALVAFLAGKKMLDNVPAGVTMSLADFRICVGEIIAQAALRLTQTYKARDAAEKSNIMVLSYTDKEVRVAANVYDQWAEAGGQVAALFGSLLSDRPALSAIGINNGAEDYIRTWENHNRNLTTVLQSRRLVDMASELKFKTQQLVAERIQDCYGTCGAGPGLNMDSECVRTGQKHYEAIIDGFSIDDYKDLWKVCTKVIAGGVFYYTDSLKFLERINAIMEENPGLPAGEAVLQAIQSLVVDFIADQITVVDL